MNRLGEELMREVSRSVAYDMKFAIEKSFMLSMTQTMAAPDNEPFSATKLRDMLKAIGPIPAPIKMVESEFAVAFPKAKPCSDDMRDMVEHLYALGLVEKKPCALQIENTMYVHPILMRKLRAAGKAVLQ